MKYLVTFGCSWVWGAGCGFSEGMSREQYKKIVWDESLANQFSFRSLLADRYGYKNINYSIWKSSNQKQFRLAKQFFSSAEFKQLKKEAEEIVVLWGLTTTGRDEVFSVHENKYVNFLIGHGHPPTDTEKELSDFFVRNLYVHEHEVFKLANEMTHWNDYFSLLGVKNYWFDSFNHHDYTVNSTGVGEEYVNRNPIQNMAIDHIHSRDLLSQLALRHGIDSIDNRYHTSAWANDTNRLNFLIDRQVLNPYSYHPTKQGHKEIAEFFDPIFNKKS